MKVLNKALVKLDEKLPMNIYIRIGRGNIILLLEKDTVIAVEDISRLEKYPSDCLLVSKEGYNEKVNIVAARSIAGFFKKNKVDSFMGVHLLKDIFNEEVVDLDTYFEKKIADTKKVVEAIFDSIGTSDFRSLSEVLRTSTTENSTEWHGVSLMCIGSLLAFSIPNISPGDIWTFNKMCCLHVLGLQALSGEIRRSTVAEVLGIKRLGYGYESCSGGALFAIQENLLRGEFSSSDSVEVFVQHFFIMEKACENIDFFKEESLKRCIAYLRVNQVPKTFVINHTKKNNNYVIGRLFHILEILVPLMSNMVVSSSDCSTNPLIVCLAKMRSLKHFDGSEVDLDTSLIDHFCSNLSN